VPIIGVEVDFLKKSGVDALSASLTEDGLDFSLGSVVVVACNLGRAFTWVSKCGVKFELWIAAAASLGARAHVVRWPETAERVACGASALVIRGAGSGRAVLVKTARAVVAVLADLTHAANDCGGPPLVFSAAFATLFNKSTDSFGEKGAYRVFRAAAVEDSVFFVTAAATAVATAAAGWVGVNVVAIARAEAKGYALVAGSRIGRTIH
jgi:hypothetical protein